MSWNHSSTTHDSLFFRGGKDCPTRSTSYDCCARAFRPSAALSSRNMCEIWRRRSWMVETSKATC